MIRKTNNKYCDVYLKNNDEKSRKIIYVNSQVSKNEAGKKDKNAVSK